MIRLKDLLFEQGSEEKTIPSVLFIGDVQTVSRSGFARKLIRSGEIQGAAFGTYNINAVEFYRLLQRRLKQSYNVVTLQVSPNLIRPDKASTDTTALTNSVERAKEYGAKVVLVVTPATKQSSKMDPVFDKWLDTVQPQVDQIITDRSASAKSMNPKTGVLNDTIQQGLQKRWVIAINKLLQTDIVEPEPESEMKPGADTETSDLPTYSALGKIPSSAAEFIEMWKDVAVSHMNKYGIPASITLAQAALESAWGKSRLARKGNNYFGIKCHGWTGDKIYASDDRPNECFRKYPDASGSFEDHAKFLMKNSRYDSLFKLPATDYRGWAKGLKAAGYATASAYAETLIKLIEQYGLNRYDGGDTMVSKSKSDYTADSAEMQKILSLPFNYQDISNSSTYRRKDEKLKNDKYFIVHHTAGRGTPAGVVSVLNRRNLGVQWVVDRAGNIFQTLPRGARGAHILDSDLGPNNSNSQGVEVIAKNDADILPIQAAAVFKLVKALGYSPSQIYGHGEVNPGHKQATEGQTIKQYILNNWGK